MHMLGVGGYWPLELLVRQLGVDEQVMVTGALVLHADRRNAHAGEAELHLERTRDRVTVLEIDEIHCRTLRRRRLGLRERGGCGRNEDDAAAHEGAETN